MSNAAKSEASENGGPPQYHDEHVAGFSCSHVVENASPILYVLHDLNGDWQFLCGQSGHDVSSGRLICSRCIFEQHRELGELFDLPSGLSARRPSIQSDWIISDVDSQGL